MEEHSIVESVLDNLPVAVFAKDATNAKKGSLSVLGVLRVLGVRCRLTR